MIEHAFSLLVNVAAIYAGWRAAGGRSASDERPGVYVASRR